MFMYITQLPGTNVTDEEYQVILEDFSAGVLKKGTTAFCL